jgi:hypothetical protein
MSNGEPLRYRNDLLDVLQINDDLRVEFTDVVTQVYPLRADISALQDYCEKNINLLKSPLRFRAAAPWVLLQIANYGKIAADNSNVGWFAQHEVAFGFPVEWYQAGGAAEFQDWGMFYPFIFVDSPISLAGGREIYGWSKVSIEIGRSAPSFQPNEPHSVVSVIRTRYSPGNALLRRATYRRPHPDLTGTREEFLQIVRQRPFITGRAGLSDLFTSVPKAIEGLFNAGATLFGTLSTLSAGAGNNRDLQSLQALMARAYGHSAEYWPASMGVLRPPASTYTRASGASLARFPIVTLKQFREAQVPTDAYFQAVIGSSIAVTNIKDGGLLFDPLAPDLTGGIQINLLRSDEEPIKKELGLEAAGQSLDESGKVTGDFFRPIVPIWTKLDMSYGPADFQYWRTATTDWTDASLTQRSTSVQGGTTTGLPPLKITPGGSGPGPEVPGPFTREYAIVHIFAVEAGKEKLEQLVKSYLENGCYEFSVKPSKSGKCYIYVLVTNFPSITAGQDFAGYGDKEVIFSLPVEFSSASNSARKTAAMVPLYSFVGTDWNFITQNEEFGRLTFKSSLVSPPDAWIETFEAGKRHDVLNVSTTLFPTKDKRRPAEEKQLIRIQQTTTVPNIITDQQPLQKYLEAVGLTEYISNMSPQQQPRWFWAITLKQVRDAKEPSNANYMSVLGVRTSYQIYPCGGYEGQLLSGLEIALRRYDGFDLISSLDLKTSPTDNDYSILTSYPGVGSFYACVVDNCAHNLCSRVAGQGWQELEDVDPFELDPSAPEWCAHRPGVSKTHQRYIARTAT